MVPSNIAGNQAREWLRLPANAKYRLFVWLDARICPDSATIAIARDDDTGVRDLPQRPPLGGKESYGSRWSCFLARRGRVRCPGAHLDGQPVDENLHRPDGAA